MGRFKKQIALFVCTILVVSGCICSFSFESNATDIYSSSREYYVNYARPSVSDTTGYINILLSDDSMITFFWTLQSTADGGTITPMTAILDLKSKSITFGGVANSSSTESFYYSFYMINQHGTMFCLKSSDTSGYTRSFSNSIVGWQAYGNVTVNTSIDSDTFAVYYSEDGAARLLLDVVYLLQEIERNDRNIEILSKVNSILSNTGTMKDKLANILEYTKSIDTHMHTVMTELEHIWDLAEEILAEEEKQTSWLEKIWNSIQEFLRPDSEDKETTDNFQEDSSAQSDKMNQLNEQNKTDKVDVGSASSDVDANIDFENVGNYGGVLAVITENEYILQMMLVVVAVSLVAYVLFGKK